MTYWIYSMGLPVPVRSEQLKVKGAVKSISPSAKEAKIADTEQNFIQRPSTSHVDYVNTDTLTLNKPYQQIRAY